MNQNNSSKKSDQNEMPKFKTPKMFPTTDCGETETQAKALYEQWEVIALAGKYVGHQIKIVRLYN